MKTIKFTAYDSNGSILEVMGFVEGRKTVGLRRIIKASMKRCIYFGNYPFSHIVVSVINE